MENSEKRDGPCAAWPVSLDQPSLALMSKGRSVEQILANPESAEFKNKATKITSWTIRADAVRRLDRGEAEPRTPASETSDHSSESSEAGTF
jgi:hypothetical protein